MRDAMKKKKKVAKLFSAWAKKQPDPQHLLCFCWLATHESKNFLSLYLLKKVSFTEMSNPTSSCGSSQLLLGIHFGVLELLVLRLWVHLLCGYPWSKISFGKKQKRAQKSSKYCQYYCRHFRIRWNGKQSTKIRILS